MSRGVLLLAAAVWLVGCPQDPDDDDSGVAGDDDDSVVVDDDDSVVIDDDDDSAPVDDDDSAPVDDDDATPEPDLDGGGSTTMVVQDCWLNHVVNHPSDNLQPDHDGARAVASGLYVR